MLGVSLLETGEIDVAKEVSVFCGLSCCPWPNIIQASQSLIQPPLPQPPLPSAHLYLAQLSEENPTLATQHYQATGCSYNSVKGKHAAKHSATTNPPDETKSRTISSARSLAG
jgi:hypothetical protein